jgi:regulator of replication initiation timing
MNMLSSLNQEEVNAQLVLHEQWLNSDGRIGVRANFSNCKIEGFNFRTRQLRGFSPTEIHALLQNHLSPTDTLSPRIDGANFSGAWLTDCNFEFADCTRCNFSNATVIHCSFKSSILNSVNFDGSTFIDCEGDDERIHQNIDEKVGKNAAIEKLYSELKVIKQELDASKGENIGLQTEVSKLEGELIISRQEHTDTKKQLQGMVAAQEAGETYYGSAFASLKAAKTEANRQLETLIERRNWLNEQAMDMVSLVKKFAWSFIFGLSALAICTLLINIEPNKLTFLNSLIRYMAGATIFTFTCTLALFALVGRTQRQMLTFSRVIMAYETYESMLNFSMAMEPIRDKKTKDPINLEFGRAVNSFMAQTFREVRKNSFAYFNRNDKESAETDVFSGLHELSRIFGAGGGRKNTKQL